MQSIKNAGTSMKNGCKRAGKSVTDKYSAKKAANKVRDEEIRRQRTAIYKFKVIKKMKELHDFCLEQNYDRDLREMYIETLNNVLIKKIVAINSSIEISFKFTMNNEEVEDQFVDPFVVFVRNCLSNYNLEELKVINRYVTKFLN